MTVTINGSNLNTIGVINSMTAKTATGTSVDFTGIPAGVKRVSLVFSGVGATGTSQFLVRIGSGSYVTTGYASGFANLGTYSGSTSGFNILRTTASDLYYGIMELVLFGGNLWVCSSNFGIVRTTVMYGNVNGGGQLALSGALDRIQLITTSTDTFNAGSVNVLYE